jgi:EsV-1-7 cysteine-rich motif
MCKCNHESCTKQPSFNYENEKKPLFCNDHKETGMINVKNRKYMCKCGLKRPSYNYEGLKPICCITCKEKDMVDIVSVMCEKCNKKRATYNYEGMKPLFCKKCKEKNMIDVKSKRCKESNCTKQPCFNYENKKSGLYCELHKKDRMVDVKHKKCEKCNKNRATSNFKGLKPIYCNACKEPNMINVNYKFCEGLNCIKYPSFNFRGLPAIFCKTCKKDGMIDVKHKRCEKCDTIRACFNFKGLKPFFCLNCKEKNMINVVDKQCILCESVLANERYDDHCLRCFIYSFPDNNISRIYKVKERHVTDFIEKEFPKEFIFDKVIEGGCSKRRPDAFKDCGTHSIIIEVDENQHKTYEEICENKRTMELFRDLANRPIIFIRFNPDSYMDKNNNRIKSCFKMNKKTEVPSILSKNAWNIRLLELKETIKNNIINIPEKEVHNINLFYNI